MTTASNPSFEPPADESDNEIWLLRAPAHLDVSELLNGVTIDVDPKTLQSTAPSTSNNILSTFKSDGSEYALTVGDANESDNLRLLVPDGDSDDDDDDEPTLKPYRAVTRQIHLTSVMSSMKNEDNPNVQADLIIAPATENAPKPAYDESGNGSVDTVRLAYVPVPQRQGLMRRWQMPGCKIRKAAPSALCSEPPKKKARVDKVVSDDEPRSSTPKKDAGETVTSKSTSKKSKKKDKKSEKKSKKSKK